MTKDTIIHKINIYVGQDLIGIHFISSVCWSTALVWDFLFNSGVVHASGMVYINSFEISSTTVLFPFSILEVFIDFARIGEPNAEREFYFLSIYTLTVRHVDMSVVVSIVVL